MEELLSPEEKTFLAELTELSKRHGITVGGCGCCGSPFLSKAPEDAALGRYVVKSEYTGGIAFVSPSDKYGWERYGDQP